MRGFTPAKQPPLRLDQCTNDGLGWPAPESWKSKFVQTRKEHVMPDSGWFYPNGFALYEFSPEGGLYLGRHWGRHWAVLLGVVRDVWAMLSPSGAWGIGEIERVSYDPVKGSFEYKNVYWVALGALWTTVREGKRLEPWMEGAVKKLAEVKTSLVPQDVMDLFAVHTDGNPDSVVLFSELGQDEKEQLAVIRDRSGHGHDLTVKPGTPQPVFETDEIFGSPTRCCQCDSHEDVHQAQTDSTMYPAFFCGSCGREPLEHGVIGAESISKAILRERKRRGLPDPSTMTDGKCKHGHVGYCGFCANGTEPTSYTRTPPFVLGGVQRWTPIHGAVSATSGLKFYGQLGVEDVWLSETFTKTPADWHPIAHFCAIAEDGTSIGRYVEGLADLLAFADTKNFNLALAAQHFIEQLGGRTKVADRALEVLTHKARESESCAGCGKPSTCWLDDHETVRVCDECDDLIPPNENGVVISADDAVGWVKRLRDPYARHTLWEQRVRVWDGTMALELLDPKGKEHADSVWQSQTQAFARMTRALDEEQYARHQREFKPLRTDADVRKANERLRLLLSGDLVGRRLR